MANKVRSATGSSLEWQTGAVQSCMCRRIIHHPSEQAGGLRDEAMYAAGTALSAGDPAFGYKPCSCCLILACQQRNTELARLPAGIVWAGEMAPLVTYQM